MGIPLANDSQLANVVLSSVELKDGSRITIRVMRPEDSGIEQDFVRRLSARSKYLRFFSGLKQLSPRMLEKLTNPEYPESYALLAIASDGEQEQEIGVARYAPTGSAGVAEFAVVVADEWQGLGVASLLLHGVIAAATVAGIGRLEGLVLRENDRMMKLSQKLGFRATRCPDDDPAVVRVSMILQAPVRDPNQQNNANQRS